MLENKVSEKVVLTSLIKNSSIREKHLSDLRPDYFTVKLHVQIFELLSARYYTNKEITEDVIISAFPDEEKSIEELLLITSSSIESFSHHLTALKKAYRNRAIYSKLEVIKRKLFNGDDDVDPVSMFDDIEQIDDTETFRKLEDIMVSMEEQINRKKHNEDKTGIFSLDKRLMVSPGDLTIIGARPSMGKTGFMNTLALNKLKFNKGACIFSLEMPSEKILARMIANEGMIPMNEINRGLISDFNNYANTKEKLIKQQDKLLIIDHVNDVETIVKIIHQIRINNPLIEDFFIDHLGFVRTHERFQSEHHKYGFITKSLKKVAKLTGAKIWLLSQLNRGVENKTDRRPSLSDLRESGSIEEDADNVIGLYRDSYYKVKEGKIEVEEDPNELELIILKQRDGPTGIVKTKFSGRYMKVDDHIVATSTVNVQNFH